MNAKHFLEWFEHQLCPHIPAGSIIVLDNASYHNTQVDKIPTMGSRKDEIKEWLTRHDVVYGPDDLKKDLLAKVKEVMPTKQYETNRIAEKFTHQVLRLPVAHPELNPV